MACLEQERFDLLLLDLKIPDVDGLAVLRRARELYPDLAAITMASYATLQHAIASLQAGAQDFLLKPFDPDDLLRAVYEVLAAQRQEQKALEERVARQQLASILERISDGLVALDIEWRHTYVNELAVLTLNRRRPAARDAGVVHVWLRRRGSATPRACRTSSLSIQAIHRGAIGPEGVSCAGRPTCGSRAASHRAGRRQVTAGERIDVGRIMIRQVVLCADGISDCGNMTIPPLMKEMAFVANG